MSASDRCRPIVIRKSEWNDVFRFPYECEVWKWHCYNHNGMCVTGYGLTHAQALENSQRHVDRKHGCRLEVRVVVEMREVL